MQKNIGIVGGGLIGSILAVLLSRRGHRVDVFERRSDFRKAGYVGGRSINLALSDRGWNALEKVGLRELIEPIAIPMYGRTIHQLDGSTVFAPYGENNQAIYSVSRGDLNLALVNAAEKNEGVHFHFDVPMGHETDVLAFSKKYDYLFGADGAFSEVRYQLQKTAGFNFSQTYETYGYKELHIPAADGGGFRIHQNSLHIWPRKSFMMIALPNPDGSFTCTLFASFKGENSFEQLTTEKEVRAFFEEQFPSAIPLMPDLLHDFFQNPTASLCTMRCYPWVHGNIALIGDAAHAIVPFYGQGMNCGFEDVRLLGEFLDAGTDWDQQLDAWQKSRKPNADAIADLALYNYIEMRDLSARPEFILRQKIEKRIAAAFPDRFQTLYSMVTFNQTPYADALARGRKQGELLDEIMSMKDIETAWESEVVLNKALNWLDANKVFNS
ncbi:MAG: NAD(P)/FAD-dependent oxidoreductase [Chitinophagales bacterium]